MEKQIYTVRIETQFLLTPKVLKDKLGVGYNVKSVDVTGSTPDMPKEVDVDHMAEAIVTAGWKSLARVCHPDIAGPKGLEKTKVLNQTKQQLIELLKQLQMK